MRAIALVLVVRLLPMAVMAIDTPPVEADESATANPAIDVDAFLSVVAQAANHR